MRASRGRIHEKIGTTVTLIDWSILDRLPAVEDADDALVFLLCQEGDAVALADDGPLATEIARIASLAKGEPASGDAPAFRRLRTPLDGVWFSLVKIVLPEAPSQIALRRWGAAAAALIEDADASVHIAAAQDCGLDVDALGAFLRGLELRRYAYLAYKSRAEPERRPSLGFYAPAAPREALAAAIADAGRTTAAVHFARDLVNAPPNALTPRAFADACRRIAPADRLIVDVLDEQALRENGFRGLLAVGAGSENESCVVVLRDARVAEAEVRACLIGKGVCFDSGGLSLKSTTGIRTMKIDMAGAAVVAAAMRRLVQTETPLPVAGVLGLVENMPDGRAYRPGDVLRMKSGKTVEIVNTDAEGRLVLADAMAYAQERFAPKLMLDLATLTGGIVTALGHDFAGVFANDDGLADALRAAGIAADEDLWRMPLAPQHRKLIRSAIADVKQAGPPAGTSISAATFLAEFVAENVKWAHFDIAGVAHTPSKGRYWDAGASGWGVTTLVEFFESGAWRDFA